MISSPSLISVVLPVYNASPYLAESIESILNQTYSNFELIVVNDGSNDSSIEIVQGFNDPRIRFINRTQNKGLIFSLNEGIAAAQGKYIARMDADDICSLDRLEKQIDFLEKNNSVDILGSDMYIVNSVKKVVGLPTPLQKNHAEISKLIFGGPILFHPTVMARSSVLKDNPYSESHRYIEDFELWVRLIRKGIVFGNLQEKLLFYRRHEGAVSISSNIEQKNALISFVIKEVKSRYGFDLQAEVLEFILWPHQKTISKEMVRSVSEFFNNVEESHFFLTRQSILILFLTFRVDLFFKCIDPSFFRNAFTFWVQKGWRNLVYSYSS